MQVWKDKQKDTLLEYSNAQKQYDSYYNEWDCCLEWGQDREDMPMDDSLNTPSPPPTAPSPVVLSALAVPDSVTSSTILVPSSAAPLNMPTVVGGEAESGLILAPAPVEKDQDITGEQLRCEVLWIISKHFGFVPLLPLPSSCKEFTSDADKKSLVTVVETAGQLSMKTDTDQHLTSVSN
ncbi:hypothetical protein P691DRAFT_760522 [Macrolepiota fuliginosa MF-IS2]|uniref:Uncharacterized protein n=1 Tax=Macrolepiota fuliginosa MF-IS2 TaxID=1400762 RepID=A0A9P6C3W7_9AGAR|nr:hypothetical protein P691DRAFT_760522 [Macrolepiota fuliginosa MF-IS2]